MPTGNEVARRSMELIPYDNGAHALKKVVSHVPDSLLEKATTHAVSHLVNQIGSGKNRHLEQTGTHDSDHSGKRSSSVASHHKDRSLNASYHHKKSHGNNRRSSYDDDNRSVRQEFSGLWGSVKSTSKSVYRWASGSLSKVFKRND